MKMFSKIKKFFFPSPEISVKKRQIVEVFRRDDVKPNYEGIKPKRVVRLIGTRMVETYKQE